MSRSLNGAKLVAILLRSSAGNKVGGPCVEERVDEIRIYLRWGCCEECGLYADEPSYRSLPSRVV